MGFGPLTENYRNWRRQATSGYTRSDELRFTGGMVGITAEGLAVPMSHLAPMRFVGVSTSVSRPGEHRQQVWVDKDGQYIFRAYGFDPQDVHLGCLVYAFSDWEVCIDKDGLKFATPVGTIQETGSAHGHRGVRIRIDRHTV